MSGRVLFLCKQALLLTNDVPELVFSTHRLLRPLGNLNTLISEHMNLTFCRPKSCDRLAFSEKVRLVQTCFFKSLLEFRGSRRKMCIFTFLFLPICISKRKVLRRICASRSVRLTSATAAKATAGFFLFFPCRRNCGFCQQHT